jgi:hypothetical protein
VVEVLAPLHDHHGEGRRVVRGLAVDHGADGAGAGQGIAGLGHPELLESIL